MTRLPKVERNPLGDGTRASVNVSMTALTPSSWSRLVRTRRYLIFNRLPEAEGWHGYCIQARADERPTTMGR